MPTTTPVTVKQTSTQWSIHWKDVAESLVAAIITPVVPIVTPVLSGGSFNFNKDQILAAAALGFVGWLVKRFVTPSQTIITGTTPGGTVTVTPPAPGTTTAATQVKP
jgi:uncharacterized membrane protein YjjB (DUF3815 family)